MTATAVAADATAAKPKVAMVEITPRKAEQLLERNTHNRSVRDAAVQQYARDMRNGDWRFNGEAIKIAIDGQILDGQHRLMACLEADVSFTTLLITGLPNESQETMDQGRSRNFSDMLKLRGEKNYTVLSTAVRMVCLYERDGVPLKMGFVPVPSAQEMFRCLERNPEIRDSVELGARLGKPWLPATMIAGLHYLFASVNSRDATSFFEQVALGDGVERINPAYVLRERLITEHAKQGVMLRQVVRFAFVIRAWNAWRNGEVISKLQWNPGGADPEKFPHIDGLENRGGGLPVQETTDTTELDDARLADELHAVCHEKPVSAELLAKTRNTTVHKVTRLLRGLEAEGRVSQLEDGSWCA